MQQSGFVRSVPRSRVEEALRRMGRGADEPVQGAVAREVAERTGAGLVLATTVARAGTRYLLSGRALVPATGEELFAVRTSAGERKVLQALERLSREVRSRLGEAAESLRESRPLPEVNRYITRTNIRLHATLFGWEDLATAAEFAYPPLGDPEGLLEHGGEALVRAAGAIRRRDGATALRKLEGAFPPGAMPMGWRTFDELLRGYAFELLGETDRARIHLVRAGNRGWTGIAALTKDRIHLPLVREALERLETDGGRPAPPGSPLPPAAGVDAGDAPG
jgi:hypothetical protein